MKRFWPIATAVVVLGLFARQRFQKEPVLTLPSAVAGWSVTTPPACSKPVPAELKVWRGTAAAGSVCVADYAGTPAVKLTMYYMPDEFGSAFDAAQKWQPQPGKMSFFQGHYFGVAEAAGADPFTIERFVVAVEATLPRSSSEWHH